MINLLIVDDDPFIRESLKVKLDLDPEFSVRSTCENGEEAFRYVRDQGGVDGVLMDIRMPGCDGVVGTRLLKSLDKPPAVLILTTFDDDDYIAEAIRNGANGYLLKNVPPAEREIVRHIAAGKSNKEIAGALFLSEGP